MKMEGIQTAAAIAAGIGACFAAIVALIPIYQQNSRTKARARNLRMRLVSKLVRLRPTLASMSSNIPAKSELILSADDLESVLIQIERLLSESHCLFPIEQDRVSAVAANLELVIPYYRNENLSTDGADNLILLVDRAVAELEEGGLLASKPHQPWKSDSNA